ncbi:MAG: DNA methyltransferase [Methanothrix sp.]|nr:DNA methyltransferase [Methanothrix sp.]
MKELIRRLDEINWDFSDYSGSTSLININSMHWYPAPFVPQIPTILIQALSDKGDTILDPFAGSGVTLIEALKLKRKFVGVDINPHAINIIKSKINALSLVDKDWTALVKKDLTNLPSIENIETYCENHRINKEVFSWFDIRTLDELCRLHQYASNEKNEISRMIKKTILSSILQRCCSQRDHYTYVTDGCFPRELKYINAISLFLNQIEHVGLAVDSFRRQFQISQGECHDFINGVISLGDARNLDFLKDSSIDMVVTSPPYLGVNDYIRSLRLTKLFFDEYIVDEIKSDEIGARWKRKRKSAYNDYMNEMQKSFSEMSRVLKPDGFLCIVLGQGHGKVSSKKDVVEELITSLKHDFKFNIKFRASRKLKFRRIRVEGIGTEEIIILNRMESGE